MSNYLTAAHNLGMKALRRLAGVHKPLVRRSRKRARAQEQLAFAREAQQIDDDLVALAAGSQPIVAGPWLAEVGYEALYWVPFVRWFQDVLRVAPARLTIVSRGGVDGWYSGLAGSYIDLFDHLSPSQLAARNHARMLAEEAGGRKQSAAGSFDYELLAAVGLGGSPRTTRLLHPSTMFRLFRHVWHGSLPFDWLWSHTDYERLAPPPRPSLPGLPADYIAVKLYSGTALPDARHSRDALRALVRQAAEIAPVVSLETGLAVDDHEDYMFGETPGVVSARGWMDARHNLGVQTAIAANARMFIGTCGGLAWLIPFYGVPTVAVYADDRQLAPHLFVARQAGRKVGAADFSLIDLRAHSRLGVLQLR